MQEERIESVEPHAVELVADPPDEMIPKPVQRKATDSVRNTATMAMLVTAARSWRAFRLRTTAAVVFALALPFLTRVTPLFVSYVLSMLLWEGLVLLVVTLTASTNSGGSPLGWFGFVIMAVAQFHPSLSRLLEGVCLLLCVGSVVLQDLCTMLFFTVLSWLLPKLPYYYELLAQ